MLDKVLRVVRSYEIMSVFFCPGSLIVLIINVSGKECEGAGTERKSFNRDTSLVTTVKEGILLTMERYPLTSC